MFEKYYGDGITMISDPFWKNACKCGHVYLSCMVFSDCPKCGNSSVNRTIRTLGTRTYEEVVKERGQPLPYNINKGE